MRTTKKMNLSITNSYKAERGLTLIELMVAMTIALAILAAVGYVFLQGRTGYKVQDAQSRMQEELRTAAEMIKQDLQTAGRFGCARFVDRDSANADQLTTFAATGAAPYMVPSFGGNAYWYEKDKDGTNKDAFFDVSLFLRGYSNGVNWPANAAMTSNRLANTDTLVLIRGSSDTDMFSSMKLLDPLAPDLAGVQVGGTLVGKAFKNTDPDEITLLALSDCIRGEVVKATVASGVVTVENTFNKPTADAAVEGSAERLKFSYDPQNTVVSAFEPLSYYIAVSPTTKLPTLYKIGVLQKSKAAGKIGLWDSPSPIVTGVENMQLRFSVNLTGAPNGRAFYKPSEIDAAQAANKAAANIWLSVSAVEVTLTMASDNDNVATQKDPVKGDFRLRQSVRFTVDTRNTARDERQMRAFQDQGETL
jgi:type IV pilus assembly protein PilW